MKVKLNRLINLIHNKIRDFRIKKFEDDMQKASDDGNIWKLAIRIKENHRNVNSPIHGRDGVKYDAIGKAKSVADCLEDQFRPNETDNQFQDH